jgi:hypothetical protein
MTMTAIGKSVPEENPSPKRVEQYAGAVGDMLCAYLETIARACLRRSRPERRY